MAKTALLFQPVLQFFDDNGAVLNGGTLSFKEAGTTTDKDTYADKDQNTTNPNPITLDSAGRPDNSGSPIQIWLQGSYKIIVKDGDGNTIRTEDNVTALAEATGYAAKTANYTATTADYSKLIDVDASSAAVTVILPAAADAGAGFIITVRKSDGSSNTVTVDGNASETINGSTSITLNDQYQTLTLICDGSNWSIKANYGTNTVSSSDNRTDTVNRPFTVKSITSATPADGIGTGVLIQAESEDEEPSNFGTIDFRATDVSSATEDTEFVIQTRVAGADLSDAYKWRVTDSSNYIFTGAPTVERTVTLPDADVTFGGEFTTGAGTVTFGAGAVTFGANDFEADYTGGKLSLSGTLTADRVITIPDADSRLGDIELITSTAASNDASIEFTNLDNTYEQYIIVLTNIQSATDSVELNVTLSDDNGSTYKSTGYYEGVWTVSASPATGNNSSNTATNFTLTDSLDNTTGAAHGTVKFTNIGESEGFTGIEWQIGGRTASVNGNIIIGNGVLNVSSINAIKFATSSGNITSGDFKLYGIRA